MPDQEWLYAWRSLPYRGEMFLLLARASSLEAAIGLVIEKIAGTRATNEYLRELESYLRKTGPQLFEFEGNVAVVPSTRMP
jgi:hypothetical protein